MDFSKPYKKDDFIHFLKAKFLPEDFKHYEIDLDISTTTHIVEIKQIGEVESLNLNVYEALHTSEHDPRVSLTREIFRILTATNTRRALVIFKSKNSANYRFSLVTFDLDLEGRRIKKDFSNPRRYSFFLGPESKTHTPSKMLIQKGRVTDYKDLISRFSVEVVTVEFFDKYKFLYEKTIKFLENDHAFQVFVSAKNLQNQYYLVKLFSFTLCRKRGG